MGSQIIKILFRLSGNKVLYFLLLSLLIGSTLYGQCPADASFTHTQNCTEISFQNSSSLTGPGLITDYYWDFGDGTNSVLENPQPHDYLPNNTYTVVLSVTDSSGCVDHDTASIEIGSVPYADFDYIFNSCRSVAFFNYSPSGLTYFWDFGDGNTSNQQTPWDHTYAPVASVQTYDIKLVVSDTTGCIDSLIKPVTIYPNISASFNVQTNGQCSNDEVVFDASASQGVVTYEWDFGDGNGATIYNSNTQHKYDAYFDNACTPDTSYYVSLYATNPNLCADFSSQQVTVLSRARPLLNDPNNPGDPFSNCANNPTPNNPDYTITVENLTNMTCVNSLSIDWGDGTDINGLQNSDFPLNHTYTSLGVFQLKVTAHGNNGCAGDTTYLVGNQSIPASVGINTPDNTVGCAPQEFWFEMTGWENNSPGTNYTWDFGDNSPNVNWDYNYPVNNTDTMWHTYMTGACREIGEPDYTVTLTVRNLCMSRSTTVEGMYVMSAPQPNVEVPNDTVCINDEICFTNLSSPGWGGYTSCDSTTYWTWDFGDGNTAPGEIGEENCHIYTEPGTYTVTLLGDPQTGTCATIDTSFQVVVVGIHPEFAADTVCLGTPTPFTDLSYIFSDTTYTENPAIPISSWYWDFGDPVSGDNTSTEQNPTHIYSDYGDFVVSLTVSSTYGCDSTFTDTIFVDHLFIDSLDVQDLSCHDANDGSITVYTSYGTNNITYTLNPGPIVNNTGQFNNLVPGTYFLSAENSRGCIQYDTINILNPEEILIDSISSTNITCSGDNDGEIIVYASGGTGTLYFTLLPDNLTNTTGIFENLSGGTYTVSITDDNNCGPVLSPDIVIVDPLPITIDSLNSVNVSCHGQDDGSIYMEASGGTGVLTYTLNPGNISQGTGLFENLSPNTYNVTITDENNCSLTSADIVITGADELEINSITGEDITCHGLNNGTITVDATGGTGNLTYTLQPSGTVNMTGYFDNLAGGDYFVEVTDENGCSITSSNVTINDPDIISIVTENFTDVSCHGANDGSINITATGGTGILTYTLLPDNISNTTGIFNNLPGGTYSVSVSDQNACNPAISSNIIIVDPEAIRIDSLNVIDLTCFGQNDGSIYLEGAGGTGTLTYILNPGGTTNTSGLFENLAAGTYTIDITDDNSCSFSSSPIVVNTPAELVFDNINATDISCNGANDGSITATAGGGTGTIQYTLMPVGTSNTTGIFDNLASGTYNIVISDDNGCSTTSQAVGINEPAALSIDTEDYTNISCHGADDGTISISASGGTDDLHFTLQPGNITNNSGNFTDLAAGTYSVSVTDDNGCGPVSSSNITITDPPVVVIDSETATNCTCNGCNDGTIEVLASGGTGILTYTLNPNGTSNTTGLFENLAPGSYNVEVEDENGCRILSSNLIINEPGVFSIDSINVVDASCHNYDDGSISIYVSGGVTPYTFTLNPVGTTNGTGIFTNLLSGDYTVTITDGNGYSITTNQLTVNNPPAMVIDSVQFENISCFGNGDGWIQAYASGGTGELSYILLPVNDTNNTGYFGNLPAGTYTVAITDMNFCPDVVSSDISIIEPTELNITSENTTDMLCHDSDDGSIEVTATGGTGTLTYTLNPTGTSNNTGLFTGLSAGTYNVDVTDENGCSASSSDLIINAPDELVFDNISNLDVTCHGLTDGSITASASGGTGAIEFTLTPGNISNSTGYFNNLPGGTYQISITDANSCSLSSSDIIVVEPDEILIDNVDYADISCHGANDGSITVTGSGGTGILSYNLQPVDITNNTGVFTNLSGGTYTVTVTDQNNCGPAISADIVITDPVALAIDSETATNSTCNGCDDGIIEVVASGGTGLLTYTLNPDGISNNNGTFNNLAPGIYTVYVEDENGCNISSSDLIINEPDVFSIDSLNVEHLSCHNANDGSISVYVSGGLTPYTYTLNPDGVSNNTGVFENLDGGDYTVTITDGNGYSITTNTITLINPPAIVIDSIQADDISCHGANDGSITVTASGGTGILSYNLQPLDITNNTGVFTNLSGGTYTVTVTDQNNCGPAISGDIIITDPPALLIDSENATNCTCNGCDDGIIEVTASGGTGQLTYTLNPDGISNNNGTFNNLAPGIYTVYVEDENGCNISSSDLIINEPGVFNIDSLNVEPLSCHNANDGSISVYVSGGVTPYTFTLNPDAVTNGTGIFENLDGGDYTVTITDGNGYSITTNAITVNNPPAIVIDSTQYADISCNGLTDGWISAFASGGNGDLIYTLLPDNITNTTGLFENLIAGSYSISVTDQNNCGPANSSNIVINDPPALVIDSEAAFDCTCNGCDDGSVEVTASGGTGILSYTLNPGGASNTSGTFNNLAPGTYTVDVTDENGCLITSSDLIVNEPNALVVDSVNVQHISCHDYNDGTIAAYASGGVAPYTFTLNPDGISNTTGFFENLDEGDYTISITDNNGVTTTSNQVHVNNPPPIVMDSIQSDDITCHGDNNGWIHAYASGGSNLYYVLLPVNDTNTTGSFTNLLAGTYNVMVADENACPEVISSDIVINEPALLSIDAEIASNISCHNADDGSIEIIASGGTGNLTYTLSPGGASNNTGIFENLTEGTYFVRVEDENNCEVLSSNLHIFNPQPITFTTTSTDVSCYGFNDGSISIQSGGGTGPHTYSIDSGMTYQPAADFNNLYAGTYNVIVRDSLLCESIPAEVVIDQPGDLFIQDFTVINPTCNGCTDGQATANVIGGTPPYTHSWSNGMTGNPITGIGAGTYSDTVTDANGCTAYATISLTEPQLFEMTLETHNASCFGDSSGWAVAHVSGGTTPYSYEWRTIPGNTLMSSSDTMLNAPAGEYEITVTDAFNNALQEVFTLTEPTELVLSMNLQDTVCFGDNTGWAAVTANGGVPPYSYEWNTGAQTDSIANLPAGIYTVTVTDNNDCEATASVEIIENDELIVNTIVTDPSICYGSSTQITANVVGGTPPYVTYDWTPTAGLTDPNAPSTYASPTQNTFYTVTVTDSRNCQATATAFVEVMEIPEADFSYQYPCSDSVVYFTDESSMLNGQINDWEWNFGDGTIVNGVQNPTHIFDDPGNYTISLTVFESQNGCSDTYTQTVQIHNLPDVDFSYGATCENEVVQFFNETIADTTIQSVFWDFGDPGSGTNNNSTIENPTHVYAQAGSYIVTFTVTDHFGCAATYSESITISQEPVAGFSYSGGCANIPVDFVDESDPVSGVMLTWIWEFGDGTTDTIQSPDDPNVSHLYGAAGNYLATLTVINEGGCINSIQHQVIVDAVPIADFDYENDCHSEMTEFTDLSDPNGGNNINQWKWNFGDPASGNYNVSYVQNPVHQFSAPGTYSVKQIVFNANNCSDTIVQDVLIREGPGVDFTWENPCLGEDTYFFVDTAITPITEIANWHWDFNDGSYANEMNPVHQFPNNGLYDVRLTVTDTNGCSATVTHQVAVRPLPIAFFDYSEPTCSTDSVFFNDLSTTEYGYIDMWVWDFGDGSAKDTIYFPDEPHRYHNFPDVGNYNVSLEVTNSFGCQHTFTDEVGITESPIANFYFSNACENEIVSFEDASFANGQGNIISWEWNFDDPLSGVDNTSTEQNPTHIFTSADTFDVRLIVTNFNNCKDTMIKTVNVKPAPVADFYWDISCQNQGVQFSIDTAVTNTNVITDWFWNFGDGMTSDLMEPLHIYEGAGVYTVTLSIQDTGLCPNTITRDITIHPEPSADFDFDTPSCQDSEIQFIDLSSTESGYVTRWIWNYGDGVVDTINYPSNPDPIHVYDTTGNFDVTLTIVTTDSCESTVTKPISITPAPMADFTYDGSCSNAPVMFTDLSIGNGGININQWYWDFGDPLSGQNNYSSQQNPTHIFSGPGTYDVTLIVVNTEACSDTIVQEVVSAPLPDVEFAMDSVTCFEDVTHFYADSNIIDIAAVSVFQWNFGDGTPPVYQQNASHLFQLAGEYNVTLTITDTAGCINSIVHPAEISPKPVAEFDYTNSCAEDSTLFMDYSFTLNGENVIAWQWEFGDPASGSENFSDLQNPGHSYSAPGLYDIKLIVTAESGCVDSLIRQIEVFEAPTAAFSYLVDACENGLVNFTDESFAHQTSVAGWFWEFEPGYNSTLRNPVHEFQETDTSYAVTLTITDGRGCESSITDTIFIPAGLEFQINNTATCFNQTMFFEPELISPVGDTLVEYSWNFGDPASGTNNTSTLRNPEHLFLSPGAYTVSLEAMDQNGCWGTVYKQVTVNTLPIPDFSYESFQCDSSVYFTDMSIGNGAPIDYWVWNYGDGKPSDTIYQPASPNVSHKYAAPGYYNVQLMVGTTNGCVDTISKEVFREHCIEAEISLMDTLVCQGFDLFFADSSTNNGMIQQWTWDFGDGCDTSYTTFTPYVKHCFETPGEKMVILTVESSLGGAPLMDTMCCPVMVLPSPKPGFNAEEVCLNNETVFENLTNINGCEVSEWMWDFGLQDTCITSDIGSPVYKYNTADTFEVKLLVTAMNGCYDSVINKAVVHPLPLADFDWNTACRAQPTEFIDLSDESLAQMASWQWNFGDSLTKQDTSSMRDPIYEYDSTGIYHPKLIVGNIHGCLDTIQKEVEVYPIPTSAFSYKENYDNVQGQLRFVNESEGAYSYWWDFGDGGDSEEMHPEYRFTEDGEYEIVLVSTNEYGCPDSLKITYKFMFKGLFVPNAFAPENPASEVREFRPKGVNLMDYEIMIFDSWGQQIWSSTKLDDSGCPNEGWDGTVSGKEMPMDVYLWKIRAKFKDGQLWEGESIGNNEGGAYETVGTVTLIR